MTDQTLLTTAEMARILRTHPATVYNMIKRAELPAFEYGGRWVIRARDLERWMFDTANEMRERVRRRKPDDPENA